MSYQLLQWNWLKCARYLNHGVIYGWSSMESMWTRCIFVYIVDTHLDIKPDVGTNLLWKYTKLPLLLKFYTMLNYSMMCCSLSFVLYKDYIFFFSFCPYLLLLMEECCPESVSGTEKGLTGGWGKPRRIWFKNQVIHIYWQLIAMWSLKKSLEYRVDHFQQATLCGLTAVSTMTHKLQS